MSIDVEDRNLLEALVTDNADLEKLEHDLPVFNPFVQDHFQSERLQS